MGKKKIVTKEVQTGSRPIQVVGTSTARKKVATKEVQSGARPIQVVGTITAAKKR